MKISRPEIRLKYIDSFQVQKHRKQATMQHKMKTPNYKT